LQRSFTCFFGRVQALAAPDVTCEGYKAVTTHNVPSVKMPAFEYGLLLTEKKKKENGGEKR